MPQPYFPVPREYSDKELKNKIGSVLDIVKNRFNEKQQKQIESLCKFYPAAKCIHDMLLAPSYSDALAIHERWPYRGNYFKEKELNILVPFLKQFFNTENKI